LERGDVGHLGFQNWSSEENKKKREAVVAFGLSSKKVVKLAGVEVEGKE
jgi:hypothetical protein